ncbi:MAG: hypothetical protein ACE5K2_04980 [Candidatus Zixiibacteriota bacterium]
MAKSGSHKITVLFPEPLYEEIGEVTRKLHLERSDLIVDAVRTYLEGMEMRTKGEILKEVENALKEAVKRFDNYGDRYNLILKVKEEIRNLWKVCKGERGYFSQILSLLDDAIYFSRIPEIGKPGLEAMIFVVSKLSGGDLTQEDAVFCADALDDAGLSTTPSVEGLSQEYIKAGLL